MQVQVHYEGLESSPWLEQFINNRLSKLERYVTKAARVVVNLRLDNRVYTTGLIIHSHGQDYSFTCDGENLYESFAGAFDKGSRVMSEKKRMLKDKINRKYHSLRDFAA